MVEGVISVGSGEWENFCKSELCVEGVGKGGSYGGWGD